MASNEYQVPDLASVLQTLSAYAPPAASSSGAKPYEEPSHLNDEDDEYEPPASFSNIEHAPVTEPNPIPHPQESTSHSSFDNSTPKPTPPAVAAPPPPDPSTITTWPSALQCVMKTVSQNEAHQTRIRKLIRTQHDHEKQWWAGREALLTKQRARAEKKKTLDAVLYETGHISPETRLGGWGYRG